MNNNRLRRFFSTAKVDAVLLHNSDWMGALDPNYYYFTGLSLDNSILVARRAGAPAILCTDLNYSLAKQKAKGINVLKLQRQTLASVLKRLLKGCRKVGINARSLRVSAYSKFRQAGKKFIDVSDELGANRAVKEAGELALIKKCVNETKEILDALEIRPGMTELDIVKQARIRSLEAGLDISFPPIVASGPNTRVPHSIPTSRKVGMNDVVLVDFGLMLDGYCSDLTRCYFTGACKAEKSAHAKLVEIQEELAAYAHAGLPVAEFVMESVDLIKRAGLPPLPHSIGHGVGLEVHEQPYLYAKSRRTLRRTW
ncbi:MAG: Xaa-Pro peptidase family protein [Candidatus Micrarchaeia archaeon]|jgi:Xaa-Pro aminopeptidase